MGFPHESTCQCWRQEFDPMVRKIPWSREWQPTPVFLSAKCQDRGAWRAAVHGVAKDSDDWGIDFHSPHSYPRKLIQGKIRQQQIPHQDGLTGPGNYVAWHILCSSLQETQASSPKGHLWCIFKSMGEKKNRLSFTIDLAKVPLSKEARILKAFYFLHVRSGREAWASVKTYYKQLKTWKTYLGRDADYRPSQEPLSQQATNSNSWLSRMCLVPQDSWGVCILWLKAAIISSCSIKKYH